MTGRKLRFGMVGGGHGAFIGGVHRIAAQMDGRAELVAGSFSSDPQRSLESGASLYLESTRVYGSYVEMAQAEAARPTEQRLDFVSIVTPNDGHFGPAKLFLEMGFNVVCEKPLSVTLAQAQILQELVAQTGKVFVVAHNYSGNPMVKEARDIVHRGGLGRLRKVVVEYSQGWLSTAIELSDHKQAAWRTDPARSGGGGCIADIGTHAQHLVSYVTGLRIEKLCADVTTFVAGRRLDDDANILLHFDTGARGIMYCSQVSVGEDNNLNLRVYGENASLTWHQERPDELAVKHSNRATEILRRGNHYNGPDARRVTRVPAGHPEGYLEAFANLYCEAFRAITAEVDGGKLPAGLDLPDIADGVEGMRFIHAVLESAASGGTWVHM